MNDFRIGRPDPKNWTLEEWRTGPNRKTRELSPGHWAVVGYYGKLEDLIKALVNRQIVLPDGTLAEQIPALLSELKAAEARIFDSLNKSFPE
jgi:hypothetical protein